MKHARYEQMLKGWFIGDFSPSAYLTQECEVAVKHYSAGQTELPHYHKVATEITLVLSGRVRMAGREWSAGDIIVLSPGEITDFEALVDTVNIVVKIPGVPDDKYSA